MEKNGTWKSAELVSQDFQKKYSYSVPKKNLKIGDQVLRISQEFPEKYFWEILESSWDIFWRNSQEFLETMSHIQFRKIGDQILRISQKLSEKYSKEILHNFLGKITENSQEFLETKSLDQFPQKFLKILNKFSGFSGN